jgi:Uma2 family endonuclease
MADAARKKATYDDVLAAPAHVVAQIVHGALHLQPRPRLRHARSASALGDALGPPFNWGDDGGPGGWLILDEPELHLGEHILVPDLAGFRRERMPELPDEPYLTLAPDWACEVLSPGTEAFDRGQKVPLYASFGVNRVWLVDPAERTLEVLRLSGEPYALVHVFSGDTGVRAEPFDAIELLLGRLWAR